MATRTAYKSSSKVAKRRRVVYPRKGVFRTNDPLISVFMWGVNHSCTQLFTIQQPSILLDQDFKAFTKLQIENKYFNKENLPGHFKFKEYCPLVFRNIRERFDIDTVEYMNTFTSLPPVSLDSPGRSGASFYRSYDSRFLLKSLSSEEVALMHQMLPDYHMHLVAHESKTLLPHYLGMYRLTVDNKETYWIAMRNIFSSQLPMHRKYDLKGSTIDRIASPKERSKSSPIFKDLDFISDYEQVKVSEAAKHYIINLLTEDVRFLSTQNLMDYSLLFGVHDCLMDPEMEEEIVAGETNEDNSSGDDGLGGEGNPPAPGNEISLLPDQLPSIIEHEAPLIYLKPRPFIAENAKDAEVAENEGYWPVVDKSIDVYILPFAPDTSSIPDNFVPSKRTLQSPIHSVDEPPTIDTSITTPHQGDDAIRSKSLTVTELQTQEPKVELYFMGIVDVLTKYGARKKTAHAAKTVKHKTSTQISTVNPEQYGRRFLEFIEKSIINEEVLANDQTQQ